MTELTMVVASNVKRLRAQNHLSQKDLAAELRRCGGDWSRQSLGMLESKGIRAERLSDLITICVVFQVPLSELLAGEDDIELKDGSTRPLSWVRSALSGEAAATRSPQREDVVTGLGDDDPEEVRRMSVRWSIPVDELRNVTKEISGQPSPTAYRDFLARLTPETPRELARTKRGHATRKLGTLIVNYPGSATSTERRLFQKWMKDVKTHGDDQSV